MRTPHVFLKVIGNHTVNEMGNERVSRTHPIPVEVTATQGYRTASEEDKRGSISSLKFILN
jgi:hypothetical protein